MSSKNKNKKKMGFAPNNVFYKSPTSTGLENQESTPNEKNPPKKRKNWLPNKKMGNPKQPKYAA